MLVNENLESCNLRDTSFLTIEVPAASEMVTSWELNPSDLCTLGEFSVSAEFTGANHESLEWFYDGGTSSESAIDLSYSENGSYPLTLVSFDQDCQISDTLTQTFVYDPLIIDQINTASSLPCSDSLLIAGVYFGQGQESIEWNVNGLTGNSEEFEFSTMQPGNYNLNLTLTDEDCGVTESFSYDYVYQGFIDATVSTDDVDGCVPIQVVLDGQSNFGNDYWETPLGQFPNGSTLEITEPGQFELIYISVDSTSCNLADSASFSVLSFPSLEAEMEIALVSDSECEQEAEVLFTFSGSNASEILWNTGTGETFSNDSLFFTYSSPGVYEVSGTFSNEQCQQEITLEEILQISLFGDGSSLISVPNVFSPNNDGANDSFKVFNQHMFFAEDFEEFRLEIFNRWGHSVFTADSVLDSWDGQSNGEQVSDGVYFYKISYTHKCSGLKEMSLSGTVTLLR